MAEHRLIDANHIVEVAERAWDAWNLAMATQDTNRGVNKVIKRQELCKAVKAVADDAPTIDPESLPIVQQLREKLKNEIAKKEICGETIERLDKQLEKVTAERDAAIKSLAELAEYELTVCEEFCYGDAQHDIPPCEWLVGGKCALREWVREYA